MEVEGNTPEILPGGSKPKKRRSDWSATNNGSPETTQSAAPGAAYCCSAPAPAYDKPKAGAAFGRGLKG